MLSLKNTCWVLLQLGALSFLTLVVLVEGIGPFRCVSFLYFRWFVYNGDGLDALLYNICWVLLLLGMLVFFSLILRILFLGRSVLRCCISLDKFAVLPLISLLLVMYLMLSIEKRSGFSSISVYCSLLKKKYGNTFFFSAFKRAQRTEQTTLIDSNSPGQDIAKEG